MNRNSKVHRFIKTLRDHSVTVAFAESMTCGLAAHFLSTCKGTADVFRGSVVCYHEQVKTELMRVPESLIRKHSAESKEVTATLAKNLRQHIRADLYAAITGLASNGGSEKVGKPVGTVFFCVVYKGKVYHSRKQFRGSPLTVREKACLHLYKLIKKKVTG